MLVSVNQST